MCKNLHSEMHLVSDAKMDILHGLNALTDMRAPDPAAIYHMAKSYDLLAEREDELEEEGGASGLADEYEGCDAEGKRLMEKLKHHFKHYMKAKAEHRRTGSAEHKAAMLEHMRHHIPACVALFEYMRAHGDSCPEEQAMAAELVARFH